MRDVRRPEVEPRGPVDAHGLLGIILADPDALEPGLRDLAFRSPLSPSRHDIAVATGIDHRDRSVILFVTEGLVDRRALADTIGPPGFLRAEVGPKAGRIVAIGGLLAEDLLLSPPTVLDGWTVEPWRWHNAGVPDPEEIVIECLNEDVPEEFEHREVRLTGEEIESLIGP